MKDKLLAGEVTTKEFWIFWLENAKHNAVEDLGHPGRVVPYEERLGPSHFPDFITWRSNGYDYLGTEDDRGRRIEASRRETTIDANVVANEDPDAEGRREVRAEQLNRRTKVRLDGQRFAEISDQIQTQGQPITPEEGNKAIKGKGDLQKSERTKERQ